MRTSITCSLLLLWVSSGCDPDSPARPDSGQSPTMDAAFTSADAAPETPLDASPTPDAATTMQPDAAPGAITLACTTACNAISACESIPVDPDCLTDCAADLVDCTDQELAEVIVCGEGACEAMGECFPAIGCVVGPSSCGDGICSADECDSCATDCPDACACHPACEVGAPMQPSCGECSAAICQQDPACCTETWDSACVNLAASQCAELCPTVCGNRTCEVGETEETCPEDCPPVPGD